MENAREKLIILVENWLHKEGPAVSALLREKDGKRCCMGIYLQDNCGVSPDILREQVSPEQLCKSHKSLMKKLPDWLFGETDDWVDSGLVGQLMMANDDPHGSEEGTRADIVELFAEVGVDVEFREG